MIVRVNAVLNRTVVYDSDGGFDNLSGAHLQSKVSSITSSGQRSAMMMAAFFEAVVCVICWHLVGTLRSGTRRLLERGG